MLLRGPAFGSHFPPPFQSTPLLVAGAAQLCGFLLFGGVSWRLAFLFLIGSALGLVLYRGVVSFSAAVRNVLLRRSRRGLGTILLLTAVTVLFFAPALATGTIFGRPVVGAIAPLGLEVAVGSFAFGLGMQLAGACGSGSLYSLGGGSQKMLLTLVGFSAGGFLATFDLAMWSALPRWEAVVLGRELGSPLATLVQIALLGGLWFAVSAWLRSRSRTAPRSDPLHRAVPENPAGTANLQPLPSRSPTWPWQMASVAIAMAALNWGTMALAGHPWSITWGFTLWGAETATLLGWDPSGSLFWNRGFPAEALEGGAFADVTSVMNMGIVLGAMTAAGFAGRFATHNGVAWRHLSAALLGGLLMGYGARIAYGCNIGAFLGGVASTSLHGWLWLVGAVGGSLLGIRLRPVFRLQN